MLFIGPVHLGPFIIQSSPTPTIMRKNPNPFAPLLTSSDIHTYKTTTEISAFSMQMESDGIHLFMAVHINIVVESDTCSKLSELET